MKQESFCADSLRLKGLPLSTGPPEDLHSESLWKVFKSADGADGPIPKSIPNIEKYRAGT